jgi:hypothetical protein
LQAGNIIERRQAMLKRQANRQAGRPGRLEGRLVKAGSQSGRAG